MSKSRHINMPKGLSLAEKIEYHSIPEPNSGCLLWMGRTGGSRPYAIILHEGKHLKVSRIVCGALSGEEVLHKCDNTLCIEELHLVRATHLANMQDASDKHRLNHKVTKAQRAAIRQDQRAGIAIAAEYGITPGRVSGIRGRTRGALPTLPVARKTTVMLDTPWGRLCLKDAAARAGIKWGALRHRIHAGWPHERWFDPAVNGGDRRSAAYTRHGFA